MLRWFFPHEEVEVLDILGSMMIIYNHDWVTSDLFHFNVQNIQQVEVVGELSSPDTTSDVAAGIFYWGVNAPDQVVAMVMIITMTMVMIVVIVIEKKGYHKYKIVWKWTMLRPLQRDDYDDY